MRATWSTRSSSSPRYAEVIAAEKAGKLDDLEDELFRFGRVVSGSHELRAGLTEPKAGTAAKAELIKKLLGGRALPGTVRLVTSLVTKPRGRSLEQGLESYSKLAADRREPRGGAGHHRGSAQSTPSGHASKARSVGCTGARCS